MTKIISAKDFDREVLQSAIPVFVDFYADWCGACKMLWSVIDELSVLYSQDVKFCKVNVDVDYKLASRYNVTTLPTVIIFKDGKPYEQIVGARSKSYFEEAIKRVKNGG